ncbi:hypothetical protein OC25_10500 [Pedobacter kyungheensis]|uniref:Uncharacterized protein n=1 Tax=Pedobacter kyungheensis TaxID=1069985 RepID=A0A0C1G2K3_9SPHI|nr:hypothetical protein [Pedobacter kyungheensis]KIA94339.1 hypothetical protein OC25_10500 [Pedobacter kyungheensis]
MTNIYQHSLSKASNIILKSTDRDLSSEEYNETVFQNSKIIVPKLQLDQTRVSIEEEQISFRNAPAGISFSISGSNLVEYVLYEIPIYGDIELFGSLSARHIDRTRTYIEYNKFCYKEYSNHKISGNNELIEEIKNRVLRITTDINDLLKSFEEEVNGFYASHLMPSIQSAIDSEIKRRNLKSDSESKLNPFA